MNNSAEAEKYNKECGLSKKEWEAERLIDAIRKAPFTLEAIRVVLEYRTKWLDEELAPLTDEKIAEASREYFPDLNDLGNATAFQRAKQVGYIVGAKEVRDYLKQNNPKK